MLKKEGLKLVTKKPYLYYNNWLIVFFYINNITVTYRKKDLFKFQIFKKCLIKTYKIKNLGDFTWFLKI